MYLDRLQTMRVTFEEICQGQDPWIPLGNFMNDWYAYHSDRRPELIADPLTRQNCRGGRPSVQPQWSGSATPTTFFVPLGSFPRHIRFLNPGFFMTERKCDRDYS